MKWPRTFFIRRKNGAPMACVMCQAVKLSVIGHAPAEADGIVFAISICNVRDKFSRKMGRDIAMMRISKFIGRGGRIPPPGNGKERKFDGVGLTTMTQPKKQIMVQIADGEKFPWRVRRAALNWLRENAERPARKPAQSAFPAGPTNAA